MNPCRRSGPATVRARHLQVPATGQRTDDGSAAERSDNLYCGGGYPGPVEHPWAFNPGNFSKWCHLQQKSEMFDKARKAALSEERAFAIHTCSAPHSFECSDCPYITEYSSGVFERRIQDPNSASLTLKTLCALFPKVPLVVRQCFLTGSCIDSDLPHKSCPIRSLPPWKFLEFPQV